MKIVSVVVAVLVALLVALFGWKELNRSPRVSRDGLDRRSPVRSDSRAGRQPNEWPNISESPTPDTLDPNRLLIGLFDGSIQDPLMMKNPSLLRSPIWLTAQAYAAQVLPFYSRVALDRTRPAKERARAIAILERFAETHPSAVFDVYRMLYNDRDPAVAAPAIWSSRSLRLSGIADAFDDNLWERFGGLFLQVMPNFVDSRSAKIAIRAQAMLGDCDGAKYDPADPDDLTRSPAEKVQTAGIKMVRTDELEALKLLQKALVAASPESDALIRKRLDRIVDQGGGILALDGQSYAEYVDWLDWTARLALKERRVSLLPVLQTHKDLMVNRFLKRNELTAMREVVREDFLFGDPRARSQDLALAVRLLWNLHLLGAILSEDETELLHRCRYLGPPEEHLRRAGLIK